MVLSKMAELLAKIVQSDSKSNDGLFEGFYLSDVDDSDPGYVIFEMHYDDSDVLLLNDGSLAKQERYVRHFVK